MEKKNVICEIIQYMKNSKLFEKKMRCMNRNECKFRKEREKAN